MAKEYQNYRLIMLKPNPHNKTTTTIPVIINSGIIIIRLL